MSEPKPNPVAALGEFIRSQRRLADLSLRELAARTEISNPYLSQIERGLHEPSVRVLKSIAKALNVSAETLLSQAGLLDEVAGVRAPDAPDTEAAIKADASLTEDQKKALLGVYRSYVSANRH
ncbi:MAG: helix-turn-helix domain-containing protein [Acidimicrobiales bacterium]